MRWSWYALPALIAIFLLSLAIVYLLKIKGDRRSKYLALTGLFFLIYSTGELLERLCSYGIADGRYIDYNMWVISNKLMNVGIVMSLTFLLVFFLYFPTNIKNIYVFKTRTIEIVLYGMGIIIAGMGVFTEIISKNIPEIYRIPGVGYGQIIGPGEKYLGFGSLLIFSYLLYRLLREYKKGTEWTKAQIRLLGIGLGIFGLATAATSFIPWILNVDVFPLATAFIPFPIFTTIYAIRKYRLFIFKSGLERREEIEEYINLEDGKAYLFMEKRPLLSLFSFRKFAETHKGLVVTSFPPPILKKNFGFENTAFLWISDVEYDTYSTPPERLNFEIANSIMEFMKEENVGVYIDSLHYIGMLSTMNQVIEFVKLMVDISSENHCTFVISINPEGIETRDKELLKEILDESIEREKVGGFKIPESVLWLGNREDTIVQEKCKVVFSVINGKKIKEKYGWVERAYWISSLEGENKIHPERIEFELLDALYSTIKEMDPGCICLCDIEYILRFNRMDRIVNVLKKSRDASVMKGWKFCVQLNPRVVRREDISVISSIMDDEVNKIIKT